MPEFPSENAPRCPQNDAGGPPRTSERVQTLLSHGADWLVRIWPAGGSPGAPTSPRDPFETVQLELPGPTEYFDPRQTLIQFCDGRAEGGDR